MTESIDLFTDTFTFKAFALMALVFVVFLGCLLLGSAVMYIVDITQSKHAIRRNYPVIGRFRYLFEHLGGFFRQYFFAMDREELPFNRAERSWVYRAAKNIDLTLAFGSTRDLTPTGTVLFLNSAFPTLSEDAVDPSAVTVGPNCPKPYTTSSLFNISAMSYGALSAPAVKALSEGAAKAGCWLNTGEGGVSKHHLDGGADLIFQIGTAKYGVRDEQGLLCNEKLKSVAAHKQVKMFEIKLSQGAKPGKGGILPGAKVCPEIAQVRGINVGQSSISPNGHPDIRSAADLLDMISRVRSVTGKPTGFKCVLGDQNWLIDLFSLINERGIDSAPDFITLDGADGGTGAAPQPLLDYVGLTLTESLPWLIDRLNEYGLRKRIKVIAAGKLVAPSKVAWAFACGADFVNSARGFMFALGCIQALQCHKNTCPTGITTHDKKLQRGLDPAIKSERVAHYHSNMTYGIGLIAHSCGVAEPRQLNRNHVRVVGSSGQSELLSSIHPEPVRIIDSAPATEATKELP